MKKYALLLLSILICSLNVTAQTAKWAQRIYGPNYEIVDQVTYDNSGNIYVVGRTSSLTLTFNNGVSLPGSFGEDAFFAKYNSNGVCQWAQKLSGNSSDGVKTIAIDATGNIYIGGYFYSPTLTFNNGISVSNGGNSDGFIAKYNSEGVCQWAQKMGGNDYDFVTRIALDSSGNVFLAGELYSTDNTFNNGITKTTFGNCDGFIAKYNSSGTCQWAEIIGGTGFDSGKGIAIDASSNAYIAGYTYSATLNLNNGLTLSNICAYVAKYNTNGLCQWVEPISGDNTNQALGIAADGSGTLYVAGKFLSSTLNFNNGISLPRTGLNDAFFAKYNTNGTCQWARSIAGASDDVANSIAYDAAGNVYVTGSYESGTLSFNNGLSLSNIGSSDVFVTKYNSNGTCQWAERIAGTSSETSPSIASTPLGMIAVAGIYASSPLNSNYGLSIANASSDDIFLAQYGTIPVLSTTSITSITGTSAVSGGYVSSGGSSVVIERGICWNTSGSPTVAGSHSPESGSIGSFSSSLTGLSEGTKYYVRAYATNSDGTGYGNELVFTTIPTLGQWGLIAFGGLVAIIGCVVVWRRFV